MELGRDWIIEQSDLTLKRLLPRVLPLIENDPDKAVFVHRLHSHFPAAFEMFMRLYGSHYDCFYHLEETLRLAAEAFVQRSTELRQVDSDRNDNPDWFLGQQMIGAVCYVDLFAGTLDGLRAKLIYLQEMGITYLHLMPLFAVPEPHNDGGYAVSSFRDVNPKLGTMDELEALSRDFRAQGVCLVLDFVFNHTSDEHEWAKKALNGDQTYQAYYRMFDDRTIPNAYELNLREIFPEQAPGSFTFRPEINKWIWTTFNTFQWDLNYANPDVFRAMLGEILFLANRGADVLRLDAVPFIWKELGTNCENLPAAHWIIRGFNAFVRIVAPALLFKSEAIVHPRDVQSYVSAEECQLSYNPILMSHLWDALATRETYMMRHAMEHRFALPDGASWLNYVRSHDDIGWGFADEDAAEVGIEPNNHRRFLNRFYTRQFEGSFASGIPFNYNPRTQDMRICGTTASLAGLESALQSDEQNQIEAAVQRILLIYGIVLSVGGIPLLYLGDELATTNDYEYTDNASKADDSRWIHRPPFNFDAFGKRHDTSTVEGRLFTSLTHLIHLKKETSEFAGTESHFYDLQNKHIFAYLRSGTILVLANFSEFAQRIPGDALQSFDRSAEGVALDLITNKQIGVRGELVMSPLELLWLRL